MTASRRFATFLLCAMAPALPRAALAQGLVDESAILQERELVHGDTVVRLVNFKGQLYRRIEPNDLGGLAVGDAPLHGLLVCVEGKFDRFVPPNVFRLVGSKSPLAIQAKQKIMVSGLMRGDNIWVAGMAHDGSHLWLLDRGARRISIVEKTESGKRLSTGWK